VAHIEQRIVRLASSEVTALGHCLEEKDLCTGAYRQGWERPVLGSYVPLELHDVRRPLILVVEDVEETRVGIEQLLKTDHYRVVAARGEEEAVLLIFSVSPDLVLMSLGVDAVQLVAIAQRIRERAHLSGAIPIVIFCVSTVDEGAEVEVSPNLYLTRPDNFDQLRSLFTRLLRKHLPDC
jgi:CheY-like chemotaxis protein